MRNLLFVLSLFLVLVACSNPERSTAVRDLKKSIRDRDRSMVIGEIDSLFNISLINEEEAYFYKSEYFTRVNREKDSARFYLDKAFDLSGTNENDSIRVQVFLAKNLYAPIDSAIKVTEGYVELAKKSNSKWTMAEVERRLGGMNFNSNPEGAIKHLRRSFQLYSLSNDTMFAYFGLQNIGFCYAENFENYDSCAFYIEAALKLSDEVEDWRNSANLNKYLGLVYGKLGDIKQAKKHVKIAKKQYMDINFPSGIAVANIDLGIAYESVEQYDSCIHYMELSKVFWIENSVPFRIFACNNILLTAYGKIGDYDKVLALIDESLEVLEKKKLHHIVVLEFYSRALSILKEKVVKNQLMNEKEKLIDELNVKGVSIPEHLL